MTSTTDFLTSKRKWGEVLPSPFPSQKRRRELDVVNFVPSAPISTCTPNPVRKRKAQTRLVQHHPLVKRTRYMAPACKVKQKVNQINLNLSQQSVFSRQQVEALLNHLKQMHEKELMDQYDTFCTFVQEYVSANLKPGELSYVS